MISWATKVIIISSGEFTGDLGLYAERETGSDNVNVTACNMHVDELLSLIRMKRTNVIIG